MRFRIIGNGAFGTALSVIFKKNALLEDSLGSNFEQFIPGDIFVPAVPSDVLELVINKMKSFGKWDALLLVSKGISSAKLLTQDLLHSNTIDSLDNVMYFMGPNLAKEIMENTEFLSATVAGRPTWTNKVVKFLDNIKIDESEDIEFIQIAGVLKNITAFVIGYLNPNQNGRATLIMQGINEAAKLAQHLKMKNESNCNQNCDNEFKAFIGDFVLTCTSEFSRNYTAGVNKRNGIEKNETQESLKSVDNIYAMKENLSLPIVEFFYDLIKNNLDKRELLEQKLRQN